MKHTEIHAYRLVHQQIAGSTFTKPVQVVQWMGAMQSQEYAQAKWSIGLRSAGLTDDAVEQDFNEGKILRTHVLRPTWHFVDPKDIRWMLSVSAPRVQAFNAYYYRRWNLDKKLLNKANKIITKALEGANFLTRNELNTHLAKGKIQFVGAPLSGIMMNAELEGLIISGPRKGKQFTYALLDERVEPAPKPSIQEALRELALRYFTSRGPATLQDFVWWSGLKVTEAKEAIANLPGQFLRASIEGMDYIFLPADLGYLNNQQRTFLMPDYDEYGIAYKGRTAIFSDKRLGVKPTFNHYFILDGRIEGTWRWTHKGKETIIETAPFSRLSKVKASALEQAVAAYKAFISGGQRL